jgi:hypothetical protein
MRISFRVSTNVSAAPHRRAVPASAVTLPPSCATRRVTCLRSSRDCGRALDAQAKQFAVAGSKSNPGDVGASDSHAGGVDPGRARRRVNVVEDAGPGPGRPRL